MSRARIEQITEVTPSMGVSPAVVMVNTKHGMNAARALRNCAAYGVPQLWLTGDRWAQGWTKRLPREERMKGYGTVDVYRCDQPLRAFSRYITPVAVEVMEHAENLAFFQHPANPVYVFGPEDGSLPDWARRNCHRHVIIPTRHCLNLGDAVATVLYDRHAKKLLAGLEAARPSYAMLDEQRGMPDPDEMLTWT